MYKDCNFMFFRAATLGNRKNRGQLLERETLHTFKNLKTQFNIDTVVIPITAYMKTAQSIEIDFESEKTPSDFEIENLIDFVESNGVRVLLKPSLKLLNGTNPAFIDFFDDEKYDELNFHNWFINYKKYILKMAKIAKETGVSMFSVGAGLTKSERQETMWRSLIASVRENFDGFITYSAARLREENVPFWDACDFISTDTGYRENNIKEQSENLEKLSEKLDKPFVLARENKAFDKNSITTLENCANTNKNCSGLMLLDYDE